LKNYQSNFVPQFKALSVMERQGSRALLDERVAEYAWRNGVILASRDDGDFTIHLYYVENKFVEIWMDLSKSKLIRVLESKSSDILTPYLSEIELTLKRQADKRSS
jgi:predicted nuclease of predicted toxin-antitoxin system